MSSDLLDRLLVTLAVRLRAFSICKIDRGWRLGFSPFAAVTIHFVLRGAGSFRVGSGPWTPFGPQSIIVVPQRQPHVVGEANAALGEVRAEDHCILHGDGLVTFSAGDGSADTLLVCGQIADSYGGSLGLFGLFQAPMVEAFASSNLARHAFDLMLAEVERPGLGTQAMTEVLMKQCLIVMLRQHLWGDQGSSPFLRALRHPQLARAALTVLQQPAVSYSVEQLATIAGMSRSTFALSFSQAFGQAPMDFVQKVRLRIAARLLTSTDLPVKVVANSVGYASRSSFSRSFEIAYGANPADFRMFGGQDEAEPEPIGSIDHAAIVTP